MRCTIVVLVLSVVAGACAVSRLPPDENRVPGMRVQRIDEPVFNGSAYVYEAGRQHPRSIVLVHGIGDEGARDFADHVSWLARSYHVIAVDLPGFGQSDKANQLYSPTNYATFLKYVVGRFVGRPFVLVGHSMGGVVALRYAATYPDDVARLVVADTPGILHRYAVSSAYLAQVGSGLPAPMDPLTQLARFARRLLARVERTRFDPDAILASPTLRSTVLGGDPANIARLAVVLEDLSNQLPALRVETLVIWGSEDTIALPRVGKLLARVLPRASLVTIAGAAHEPMRETPARFRAALESFLTEGLPAPPPLAAMQKFGDVRCDRRHNLVYQGDYDRLTLNGCQNVRIHNARVRELQLNDSTVDIEDSDVGGGVVGLYANESTVTMTNGSITGDVALFALASRFDLAGVEIEAAQAVMRAPKTSTIAFSLSRVRSPVLNGNVHHFYTVTPDKPL